jgi:hypothetical protein
MGKEAVKAANAQLVNDLLLEAEGRPESVTTPVGVIVTRKGKLLGNGHPVTTKYFENEFYTSIEVWLEGQTGFAMEVQGSGFEESELRSYVMGAYQVALERSDAKQEHP